MTCADINLLNDLDFKKQLTFAYLTCERLYPNYVYFSSNYNFGDASILKTSIDYTLSCILNTSIDQKKVNNLLKAISDNTPDTEHFETHFVSSALDSCTVVAETLDFLIDKKSSRLKDILTFATDTVYMYIQELESLDFNSDKDFQKKIDLHPLMQKELSIQTGIVRYLSKSKNIDIDDINTLLNLQDNNGKGSLDL